MTLNHPLDFLKTLNKKPGTACAMPGFVVAPDIARNYFGITTVSMA